MPDTSTPSRTLPTLSWVVLVVCVLGNTVASLAGAPLVVHLALGAGAAVCVAALTALYLRTRR
ncbi:hypothetical protein [Modestobacter versicolor]|uniref:Uncharacterized protein n=1 Tax=Modestobacter versicolor TaxID=429133 RepID=A0A323V9C2_9ACTN|nr:hypothetical protein [Modestobacter versicolor]MBB3676277.1 hypothetical protein [Modestobacter versicolor]PZA20593.1 hypothetical protein DMO24_14700 [Modestobacter versicolor]